MACNGIEINLGGRRICIPLYYKPIRWWDDPNPPDPRERLFRDITILATINDGIGQISDRKVRDTLSKAVLGAAKSLDLPDGVEIGGGLFNAHTMQAAE